MRTKTKYRQPQAFKDGGRVETELPVEPPTKAEPVDTPQMPVASDPPPAPTPAPTTPPEAMTALQRQIDELRKSEEIQKQQAAPQQAAADIHNRRISWVQNNPLAQQHYDRLGGFHNEAMQAGLVDMSPEYFGHMNNRLAALQGQPADGGQMPTPKFFQPPPAARAPSPPMSSSLVSAPVSREIPGSNGQRRTTPGKVTLTREEVEAARISNVTPEEYARQKLKRDQMIASGEYRNQEQR
jgi:hypothetical protein